MIKFGARFTEKEKRYIENAINNKASSLSELHFTGIRVPPNVRKFAQELKTAQNDCQNLRES